VDAKIGFRAEAIAGIKICRYSLGKNTVNVNILTARVTVFPNFVKQKRCILVMPVLISIIYNTLSGILKFLKKNKKKQ
jgi:hypothetical protein